MRLGLVVCDHVTPDLMEAAGGSDYDQRFVELFGGAATSAEVMSIHDATVRDLPPDASAADIWILTGSRSSVTDSEPWILELAQWVRSTHDDGHAILGVCFGHQMLAHALGGKVVRHDGGWGLGARPTELDGHAGRAELLYLHQDQVTQLPEGGHAIGTAPHCPIAALEIEGRAVGVQAHPEFDTQYLSAVIRSRLDRIDARTANDALATMAGGTHHGESVARWMIDRLTRAW